ncbi:MAG: GNAT family N-acetyltransferase [Paludibacteraceae bacterium]|nr:GNAT family N-acetyltransferase [Paludibacteraceae bacterium]
MTKLLTYPDIDPQQWSELIQSSPTATWFHTDEAYRFYQSVSGMQAFVYGVVEASPKSSPKGKDFQPTPGPSLKGGEHDSFARVFGAHTADSMQYDLLKENAVSNRKNPTEAESVLWDMLKGNKLGAHFRRQHIILDYIVDFICLDKGLIIELDGGYHDDPQQKEYDKARTAHLQRLGYTELRFKNEELLCNPDAVIQKITDTLEALPSISSLPFREGLGVGSTLPSFQGRAGDRLVGVIVGYITRERNPLKQYFTRRAIIYGGPLLANDISDEALSALLTSITKLPSLQGGDGGRLTPIYIESRNFHDYSKWKSIFEANGFMYQSHLNYHVDTTSIDLAQSNIGKHRWKYIRLSLRDGAQIVEHPTIEQVRAFYSILQDLYRTKVRTPLWSWEFFERLYHVEHARYILVELDGQIVGGNACVCLPGKAVYEWYACGLDNCRDDIRPLSVAIWGEMQYAAENGYPLFDFMGAGTSDQPYGVRDFKAEFGGELVENGRFLCVRKPLLYWIGKMGVKWLKRRINK